ncbi:hypothetical protein F4604DRAFT_1673178 [Suillus subluteus]|nr:hypothetical protein F4604DRAFT_1673178 [Suillus subluteus]
MTLLWKSHGFFCRGMVCYCVRSKEGVEYALKDCWVEESKKMHKPTILRMLKGVPNVVELIDNWDVYYEGQPDCTALICKEHDQDQRDDTTFCNRFHRDLSPNNFVIYKGIGYFIDFDHAAILAVNTTSTYSPGTGTMPYISIWILQSMMNMTFLDTHTDMDIDLGKDITPANANQQLIEHRPSNDLESLFYIFKFVAKYGGARSELSLSWTQDLLPWASAYEALGKANLKGALGSCCFTKVGVVLDATFMVKMTSDYFTSFRPLIQKWQALVCLINNPNEKERVETTHEQVLEVLTAFIDTYVEITPTKHSAGNMFPTFPMPPRKRAKYSASAAPPSWQSKRSTRGVGGHAAQLQKTGEILAAPVRKGHKEPTVEMSDAEENPMAPSQLQKMKKNVMVHFFDCCKLMAYPKQCSIVANSQARSGSQPSRTSHPILHTSQSLERFGFKPSTSCIPKASHSSGTTHLKGHPSTNQDIVEDRDSKHDKDSDLEHNGNSDLEHNRDPDLVHDGDLDLQHDGDFDLERNNRDGFNDANENNDQGPDDYGEHEDSHMNEVDGFDDNPEGGMQSDFDQGTNDEPNDAARQQSQEGLLVDAQDLLVDTQDLLVDAQDLHTLTPHQWLVNMDINHLHVLLPPTYTLISVLHLGQPSPQIAHSPPPSFYPPSWQAFLQAAKIEMHLQAVLTHPVPEHADALQLTQEVLDAELWRYHEKEIKMDKVTHKDDIQKHVITAATKLLKTGDYLHIPDSSNGEWKNFVSQALVDGCLVFYYSNSKKVLKNTDRFSCTIPPNGLILVAAVMKGVLSGFSETGTDKLPDLSAEKCRSDFNSLRRSVDRLVDIPKHCEELDDMLTQWAKIGMGELVHGNVVTPCDTLVQDCKEGTSLCTCELAGASRRCLLSNSTFAKDFCPSAESVQTVTSPSE